MEAQQEGRRECDLGSVVGTVMLCFPTADTTNIDGSSTMQRHSGGKYRPRSRSELQSTQTCQVLVRVTVRVRECASSCLGAIFLCLSQQKDLFQFLGEGGGERMNVCRPDVQYVLPTTTCQIGISVITEAKTVHSQPCLFS